MSGRRNDGDGAEAADPAGLRDALGVPITAATLERALTHRSYAYENGGLPTNERLEFLGDSVLSLVVTDTLFNGHPDLPEGQLAKLRAAVVQMSTLAEVAAHELNLGSFVRLGRGEEGTGGRDKPSILADTLEAVIGATYIDCGLDEASGLVHRLFDPVIKRSALLGAGLDWKTSLQELTATGVSACPTTRSRTAVPTTRRCSVRWSRWARGSSARARAGPRRPPSSSPPRPRTARSRRKPRKKPEIKIRTMWNGPWLFPTRPLDRSLPRSRIPYRLSPAQPTLSMPELPEVETVRAGLSGTWSAGRSPRPRCSTCAPSAGTRPDPTASPPRWPTAPSSVPNVAESTSGSPSTTTRRSSRTSA